MSPPPAPAGVLGALLRGNGPGVPPVDELVWWGLELLRVLLLAMVLAGLLFLLAHIYYRVRFLHAVVRIFEEKPLFIVPKGKPEPGAEDVLFPTEDGYKLRGCYLKARP